MKVLMVGADARLRAALEAAGFAVAPAAETADLYEAIARHQPQAIVIAADSPSRDTLEHLALVNRRSPQPILLFHDGRDRELAMRALRLGVSAYVAAGLPPATVRSLVEVALMHAERTQSLRRELTRAQQSLTERRWVERAKCLLMESEGLGEAAAYARLRDQAMRDRVSVEQAARRLLREDADEA
jgi:two-component system, response regulator / RNA-binding antiterminator